MPKPPDDGYESDPSKLSTKGIVESPPVEPALSTGGGLFDGIIADLDAAAAKFNREWAQKHRLRHLRWKTIGASIREIGILWSAFALLDHFLPKTTPLLEAPARVVFFTAVGLVLTAAGIVVEAGAESDAAQLDADYEDTK